MTSALMVRDSGEFHSLPQKVFKLKRTSEQSTKITPDNDNDCDTEIERKGDVRTEQSVSVLSEEKVNYKKIATVMFPSK